MQMRNSKKLMELVMEMDRNMEAWLVDYCTCPTHVPTLFMQ